MKDPNYTNWEKEKGQLIDDILKVLRQQKDQTQHSTLTGQLSVDPNLFIAVQADGTAAVNKHLVQGPISFSSSFTSPPSLTFGQQPEIISSSVIASPTDVGTPNIFNYVTGNTGIPIGPSATSYTPFLLQPYVYQWKWTSGAVDGFYLGLYAISIPTDAGGTNPSPELRKLRNHTIFWTVQGAGSRYKNERTTDAWTSPHDTNSTDFLHEDAGAYGADDGDI